MNLLLDRANLLLIKPWGMNTTVAVVKASSMELVMVVAGCEEYNRNFFLVKDGAAAADSIEKLYQ